MRTARPVWAKCPVPGWACRYLPDSSGCPLASECIKGKGTSRGITRDEYEELREDADRRMDTPEGKEIYKQRSPGIERVFGDIKANMGIRRFAMRGLKKVRAEWCWICAAYNLKKLLTLAARIAYEGPGSGNNLNIGPIGKILGRTITLDWLTHTLTVIRNTTHYHRTGGTWKKMNSHAIA